MERHPERPPRTGASRSRLAAALALAAAAAGIALAPPGLLGGALAALREPGPTAAALIAAGYVLGTVLLVPMPVFHLLAGFVLGPVGGAVLAVPASTAGACAAFATGRWLVRGAAARAMARWPSLGRVGEAVGSSGLRVVLLLRLAPLAPFVVLNYALGATAIRLRDFALASLLGSLPSLLIQVYLGSLAATADDLLSARGGVAAGPVVLSALATGAVMVAIGVVVRRALARGTAAAGP